MGVIGLALTQILRHPFWIMLVIIILYFVSKNKEDLIEFNYIELNKKYDYNI